MSSSRTEPLAALSAVALSVGRFATIHEMLEHALEKVLEVVRTDAGGVYLLDEEHGQLDLIVHRGLSEETWRGFDRLRLGEGLSGRVALDGTPIVIQHLKDDPRLTRMVARDEGFNAFASVPLRSHFKTYGTLNVHSRDDRVFSDEEVQLLRAIGAQIGLAVANTRLYLGLQASERKFRSLVENADDLIYLTDARGCLTYVNPAAWRLLGYVPERLATGAHTLMSLAHPDDQGTLQAAMVRMLAGEVVRPLEFRLRHAAGHAIVWVSHNNSPIRGEDGSIAGIQGIAHDITARRDLQAQMTRAERLADLGRMAASIAHEIRNPLGAIVNSVSVLQRPHAARDPRLLDIVREEADRLEAIIREFLLFARPPAQVLAPCSLGDLVNDTITLFRQGDLAGVDLAFHARGTSDLPVVMADGNQLRQVLWNLLKNAVEAGGSHGAIDVSLTTTDGHVTLAVTDDGPGVRNGDLVFEPFYTTKAQGTGLGLAVAARIVRDHGGAIAVADVPGRGACFTVTLPVAPVAEVG